METDYLPDTGSLGFSSNKSLSFFGKVCKFYSRTDRALPTIRCMDQICLLGGHLTDQKLQQLAILFCCPDSALHWLDLQCMPVHSHSWNDTEFASRSSVQWLCSHQHSETAMWLKYIRHSKNARFTPNFAMSTSPGYTDCSVLLGGASPFSKG